MLKRLTRNTASNYGLKFFNIALHLISVPVIVSAVGSQSYGLILLAGSIIGYFRLMDAGIPAGTVKFISEYEAKEDYKTVHEIITTSVIIFAGIGLLVSFALFAFAKFGGVSLFNITAEGRSAALNIFKIAALISIFQWPINIFGQTLDGLQRYHKNNIYKGIGRLIGQGSAILAAVSGFSVEVIFICRGMSGIIPVLFQYGHIKRLLPGWSFKLAGFSMRTLKMIFGYSMWMFLDNISVLLIYQTDRIILSLLLPVSSLTIYQVVTRPFIFIKQMSGLFNSALTPLVSAEYANKGKERLGKFIYKMSSYSNAFFAPIAIAGFYLSAPFIRLWMGPDYVQYAWIAQIACLCQLFWQMNACLGQVFFGTGVVKEVTLISIFSAVLNVPLGIWLTTEIGVAGVVFSTIFAGVISIPLQYLFAMPKLDMNRFNYFKSIIKAQSGSWIIGLLILPFFSSIQFIDSWLSFIGVGLLLGLIFYVINWNFVLDSNHKKMIFGFIK